MIKSSLVQLVLVNSLLFLAGCGSKEKVDDEDAPPGGPAAGGGHTGHGFIFPIITRGGPPRVGTPVPLVASAPRTTSGSRSIVGPRTSGALVRTTGSVVRSGFGRSASFISS